MKRFFIKKYRFLLGICIIFSVKAEVVKRQITLPNNDFFYCVTLLKPDISYLMIQKINQANQPDLSFGNKGIIGLTIPYPMEELLFELLPDSSILIGYIKHELNLYGLIIDLQSTVTVCKLENMNFRSCFEYSNPITRTFDQLNIRRCMRVGGDLIVCGKIINDPVCNVTPCATQRES